MSLMFSGASKFNKPLNFDTKNVKKNELNVLGNKWI
nr:hypothetical protein [Mycoplasmopsis bovis]